MRLTDKELAKILASASPDFLALNKGILKGHLKGHSKPARPSQSAPPIYSPQPKKTHKKKKKRMYGILFILAFTFFTLYSLAYILLLFNYYF